MNYDHIIFVSIDTLRSDCIAANPVKLWPSKYPSLEKRQPTTALLDDLVQTSAFFPNAITAAPYTSASHASYFTGQWPPNHGLFPFYGGRLNSKTIFTWGKHRGYKVIQKVDFPMILGSRLGFDQDADSFLIENDDAFLDAVKSSDRTVSFLHFGGCHIPYGFHNLAIGGQKYMDLVDCLEQEIPVDFQKPTDQLVETPRGEEDFELLLRYKRVVEYHYQEKNFERLFGLYLDGVQHFMRHRFEPVMERLLDSIQSKRFLCILFGDHGEEYDAHSYGHHNTLSEGVIRVPILVFGTGVRPGLHLDRIRTVDILPSIYSYLGEDEWAAQCDGASLQQSIWGDLGYPVRDAYSQAYTSDTEEFVEFQKEIICNPQSTRILEHVLYKEAVYAGDFKFERQFYEYHGSGGVWGLRPCKERVVGYEIHGGIPAEVPVNANRLQSMDAKLLKYNTMHGTGPTIETDADAALRRKLRAMGYRV